jgi:hypothetical protein
MEWNSTVDELIAATAEAREVIREMHAATKDLDHAVRKARYVIKEEMDRITSDISSEIRQRTDTEIGILSKEIRASVDAAVARIHDDFGKISKKQIELVKKQAAIDLRIKEIEVNGDGHAPEL